jgi:hypothetical protein
MDDRTELRKKLRESLNGKPARRIVVTQRTSYGHVAIEDEVSVTAYEGTDSYLLLGCLASRSLSFEGAMEYLGLNKEELLSVLRGEFDFDLAAAARILDRDVEGRLVARNA